MCRTLDMQYMFLTCKAGLSSLGLPWSPSYLELPNPPSGPSTGLDASWLLWKPLLPGQDRHLPGAASPKQR